MISVGSRDGRKGLSSRYGVEGGEMDLETELEEGEAYFQNNNDDDDDSTIDPDVALSYLDEKLQDVLGHFQKDFEGGVSAENLGAKFGGYGSFLPTYQRSPACPHPKTPPKVTTNTASVFPIDLQIEGGRQNSVSISNASQSTRHGPVSASGPSVPAPRGPPMIGKMKQEGHVSSAKAGDKFASNGQPPVNNFANASDHKSLKVRIRVGSDNLTTRKNAEIYSGLGLDVSPSSSLEASPVDSDDFCHVPRDSPCDGSPTSRLLSPLPDDLLFLTEKEKWEDSSCGSVHKRSQESFLTVNRFDSKADRNIICEKKPKSSDDNFVSVDPTNGNNVCSEKDGVTKKEVNMDNLSCEELVSNALKLPLLSNPNGNNVLDFRKGSAFKGGSSSIPKEESSDPVMTHDDSHVEKPYRKDGPVGNANSDDKYSGFPTKSDSDVSRGGKILDSGLVKPSKPKTAQKATSREKDGVKLATGKETSSSGGKKKPKGSQSLENGFQSVEVSKSCLKNDSYAKSRNNACGSKVEDLKINNGKVRETYKDFFGELDPELDEFDDMGLEEKPFGDKPKDYRITEKGTLESNNSSKERLNGRKGPKPSSSAYPGVGPHTTFTTGNAPVSDAASAVAAVEDWVCCDKCEKWRLLPPGVNPGSLPEKPGMNRCSISQEETTKAITSRFLGPAPMIQGSQPVHPGGPQSGAMSIDALHLDQRHQPFGPPMGVKKKHGTKDPPNESKPDRPSLSSNSTKKNLHASNKTRSLNGANPSSFELEFQDSGHSSNLIAEKQKFKHKEKKKLRENVVDEGNNAYQLKIRNKRETSQDYIRDSKKVKTEDNHGTDKDRTFDHDGAVFKEIKSSVSDIPVGVSRKDHREYDERPKDSKPDSKVLGINLKNQNGIFHMVKREERDVAKKRKSSEFEDAQVNVEEMSESGQRKAKKVKVPDSRKEERGRNVKDEQVKSLDIMDSCKRDVAMHASLAATSSSSKVSGSHKTKPNNQEAKGSPVESVSSSPLRISNPDKLVSSRKNVEAVDNCRDAVSPKKDWDDDRGSYRSSTFKKEDVVESIEKGLGHLSSNNGKAEIMPSLEFETLHVGGDGVDALDQGGQYSNGVGQGHNEERRNNDQSHATGSRARKNGKGSSSRSKDKIRSSKFDIKISERMNENTDVPTHEEKSKGGRNKSQEKLSINSDKFEKGSVSKKESSGKHLSESAKRDAQLKHGHHDDVISIPDIKQNPPTERDGKRFSKRDVSGRGKPLSLPPSGKAQNETARPPQPILVSQKENAGNIDAVEGSDSASKGLKQKKGRDPISQNGSQSMNVRHPTPNRHKGRDHDAPSPLRRESSNQAATAVKEAKALKHMADRLKNSGSNHESNSLYFQAALKFLYGSSLLESCNSESGKHGDIIPSMGMYSSTAKLCEYVAHEYEKSKEMAAAALAYKLAEVAYLKVVYSSHTGASKDRQELQTSLQIGPTGESPSSSASDIDNLNNPAAVDKATLPKGVNDPQNGGNHIIAARNKPNFLRILNFAQDVNFAMEASRRSQSAFAASNSPPEHKEVIKPALDFNFQDVEGLLQLVRVAMEVISR
ncbi:Zinc finger, CW-type [Cynara cardunculus var. scolymus]|uniref:Zinc finger, CW-type n=1 Tax=Cynara cardunculus var. scolymus TaxID=59895 RepID=A0A103YNR4_CYNCS|nr:Zinc finger, CW-type [Cynara cardunculus var. scolymus]